MSAQEVEALASKDRPLELAPLTKDTPFKRAFGSPACFPQLASLVNAMLCTPADSPLAVKEINNVELKDTVLRSVIYDIKCVLNNGVKLIIELQKAPMRSEICDRLIGYQAADYRDQWFPGGTTEAGASTYSLVPVRVLALLDFTLSPDEAACGDLVQRFRLQPYVRGQAGVGADGGGACARTATERLAELVDVTIVQLPLCPKAAELSAETPDAGKWAHLLHYSSSYKIDALPAPFNEEPFHTVAESARYDKMTVEERQQLAADVLALRQFNASEARAAQEAEARRVAEEAQRAAEEAQRAAEEAQRAAEEAQRDADARAAHEAEARRAADARAAQEAEARRAAEEAQRAAEEAQRAADARAAHEAEARRAADAARRAAEARVAELEREVAEAKKRRLGTE